MNKRRIMLVDDHSLVRAGIRSLIDQLSGFSVVAEASNIADAMSLMQEAAPEIVVTDIRIGTENGLDLVRKIRLKTHDVKLIILSMHSSEALVSEALRLGASAYLLKEAAPEELEIAIRAVNRGETFLSPGVSTKMIRRFISPDKEENPLQTLTPRQVEILMMLASGKGVKEIAYELDLSDKTIAAHRMQIMERLKVKDMVELVIFAVRHGLINIDNI